MNFYLEFFRKGLNQSSYHIIPQFDIISLKLFQAEGGLRIFFANKEMFFSQAENVLKSRLCCAKYYVSITLLTFLFSFLSTIVIIFSFLF